MELNHVTEYTESFYELSDDQQENLSNVEEQQYIKDPEAEKNHTKEVRTLKGNHFKTCTDQNCQRLLTVWNDHPTLMEFVQ